MQSLFKRYDALFLILAAVMVILFVQVSGGGFPLDDSWIHQVYGRNLAQTGRWEFVPGEPSSASTSPLYTVILALGYLLNVPFALWAHGVGTLALALTGSIGARMAERLAPQTRWVGLVTGIVMVITWHHVWAAASGMETMIFAMLTLAGMAVAWRELDDHSTNPRDIVLRGVFFGVVAGILTLARPEGIALIGLIGLALLVVRPQGTFDRVLIYGVAAGISFLVVLAPYLLLNLQITGGLLPDTVAAKHIGLRNLLAESFITRLWNMVTPLLAGGQLFLVPGIIFFVVQLLQRRTLRSLFYWIPLAWGVALIVMYAAYLPAYFQHGRYVIPALPALLLVGVIGSFGLLNAVRGSMFGRVLVRSALIAGAAVFAYFAFIWGPSIYRTDVRIIEEEMVTAARWVADNLPDDELLVLHDIGAVGYFAPRPLLDVAGLISPEIVNYMGDTEAMWSYIQERGGRYMMAFADQIPGANVNDSRLCQLYTTDGQTSQSVTGGSTGKNMIVYAITWDGQCDN